MTQRISTAREKRIIAAYGHGLTGEAAAQRAGCSPNTCYNVLRRHGLLPRGPSACRRRHTLNEDYFSCIDSEEKAYWLGFIAADGCVHENRLSIAISEKDIGHLRKIRAAMGSTHPISTHNCGVRTDGTDKLIAKFSVRSAKIVADLLTLEITARKSLVGRAWRGPQELMRHYWRGVMDGDGSLHRSGGRNGMTNWTIGVVGSEDIVKAFHAFVVAAIGQCGSVRAYQKLWEARFGGVQLASDVTRLLYDGASVYLDRKMRTAQDVMSAVPIKSNRRLIEFRGETLRLNEWAKRTGICAATILTRLSHGATVEEALTKTPERGRRYLSHEGRRQSVAEWSRETGIKRTTIGERIRRGLSVEQALTM